MLSFPLANFTEEMSLTTKRVSFAQSALTVQGFALPELKVHVKGALNTGSSRAEILEIITQMIAYCGFPAATNALLATKEVFDEIDSTN